MDSINLAETRQGVPFYANMIKLIMADRSIKSLTLKTIEKAVLKMRVKGQFDGAPEDTITIDDKIFFLKGFLGESIDNYLKRDENNLNEDGSFSEKDALKGNTIQTNLFAFLDKLANFVSPDEYLLLLRKLSAAAQKGKLSGYKDLDKEGAILYADFVHMELHEPKDLDIKALVDDPEFIAQLQRAMRSNLPKMISLLLTPNPNRNFSVDHPFAEMVMDLVKLGMSKSKEEELRRKSAKDLKKTIEEKLYKISHREALFEHKGNKWKAEHVANNAVLTFNDFLARVRAQSRPLHDLILVRTAFALEGERFFLQGREKLDGISYNGLISDPQSKRGSPIYAADSDIAHLLKQNITTYDTPLQTDGQNEHKAGQARRKTFVFGLVKDSFRRVHEANFDVNSDIIVLKKGTGNIWAGARDRAATAWAWTGANVIQFMSSAIKLTVSLPKPSKKQMMVFGAVAGVASIILAGVMIYNGIYAPNLGGVSGDVAQNASDAFSVAAKGAAKTGQVVAENTPASVPSSVADVLEPVVRQTAKRAHHIASAKAQIAETLDHISGIPVNSGMASQNTEALNQLSLKAGGGHISEVLDKLNAATDVGDKAKVFAEYGVTPPPSFAPTPS